MTVEFHKYIVIGAGPGGLQTGYFLEKRGRDYLVLERSEAAGSFFSQYPVTRRLNSFNKKYNYFEDDEFNMRHDWNSLLSDEGIRFPPYTEDMYPEADTVVRYLNDFARATGVRIRYGTEVTLIDRNDHGNFTLATSNGEFECEVLLLGTGAIATVMPDEIEGIEHATDYRDQPRDLEFYRNKRVGIIGQGNSAFETADRILGVAAYVNILMKEPAHRAWDTHQGADIRATNVNVIDMFHLKLLNGVLTPRVRRITRLPDGTLRTDHEYDYPEGDPPGTLHLTRVYDVIICCTGWRWVPTEIFAPDLVPESWHRGKYPELTSSWESANIANLFFVGGNMLGGSRNPKSASGVIHGYRYNIRSLVNLLDERYENLPLPSEVLDPLDWNELANWFYERFSTTAALNGLWGFMADAVVVSEDLSRAEIIRELPIENLRERSFGDDHVFLLTLEFGFHKHDRPPLTFSGPSDPTRPDLAVFIHPVIRHRHGGEEAEFHFGDSLLGRWDRPHGSGGAVMSYHRDFASWLEERLGAPLGIDVPDGTSPYRVWSQEEIDEWRRNYVPPADPWRMTAMTAEQP
ncbi:MAG: NAD(P)-binding domain-containing protein [Microthrixaceae bacterium]